MCDMNTTLGHRLRMLRKSVAMSQENFGKLIGKDGTTVGRYEKDILPIPSDVFVILLKEFDTSIDYLLTGKPFSEHPHDDILNARELDALILFRGLSDADQKEIIELIQFKLYKRGKEWDAWKLWEEGKFSRSKKDSAV